MHKIIPEEGNVMRVDASGRLTQSDYDQLIPNWEAFIARHGRVRLLFVMHDFHGWDPHAAWDDFRFGIEHQKSVERIAMVGEKKWQQWMTKIASWFVRADVRYFDASQEDQAERWIREK
jgi:hypothetical protein